MAALSIIIVIVNIIVITALIMVIMITITQVIYRLSHRAHCQQSAEYVPPHIKTLSTPILLEPLNPISFVWAILGLFFWYLSTLISLEIVSPQFLF